MKKILFLVTLFVCLLCSTLFSQEKAAVEMAFQKSNASLLVSQLSSQVTFIYGSVNESYSKSNFISVFSQFLRDNPPKSLEIIHEGSRADTRFVIYALTSAHGTYRVHIFYKKINNQYLINQVRIEDSNG
jgi:hypothetical protein